ncbi:MAG TPA: hypothetical protein V6D22_06630 [Candidatus Obscuribacterales bacterium]
MGFADQLIGVELAATATQSSSSALLPGEFQYEAAGRPSVQVGARDDLSGLYQRATAAQSAPIQTLQPAEANARPLVPDKDYIGHGDPGWPLKDRMAPDHGGATSPTWLIERGIAAGASLYSTALYAPELSSKLPPGATFPTPHSMGNISRAQWKAALPSQVGKVVGWSWVADTALDLTLLNNKSTSWKTIAVDVALPLAAQTLIRGLGPMGAIAASVAGHAAEKYFFEKDR